MDDINKIIETLHPLERKVLPFVQTHTDLKDLVQKTNLQEVEVMRALQWLDNKQLLRLSAQNKEVIEPLENSKKYTKKKLP